MRLLKGSRDGEVILDFPGGPIVSQGPYKMEARRSKSEYGDGATEADTRVTSLVTDEGLTRKECRCSFKLLTASIVR